MHRRLALVPLLAATLALPACGSDDPAAAPEPTAAATATTSAPTSSTSTPEEKTSPLEGTWTTYLTREALLAYIHHAGWSKKVEKALLGPKMAGPNSSELRIDFVGETFRMSRVATDEQQQSGVFWIKDGRLYLDDEAPVGELTFALHLDGDTATFDKPGDTSDPNNEGEFVDGAPVWAPGAVLWASTPWERTSG